MKSTAKDLSKALEERVPEDDSRYLSLSLNGNGHNYLKN